MLSDTLLKKNTAIIRRQQAEIERLRDLVHLCSGFLDPDSDDVHERAAVQRVREGMSPQKTEKN